MVREVEQGSFEAGRGGERLQLDRLEERQFSGPVAAVGTSRCTIRAGFQPRNPRGFS